MEITVNGKKYICNSRTTVNEILTVLKKAELPLAVRINGKTIQKAEFDTTYLKNGDEVSVIVFLGGG